MRLPVITVLALTSAMGQKAVTIHRDSAVAGVESGTLLIAGAVRCDQAGNVYYTTFSPNPAQSPLVRVSGDLKVTTAFDLSSAAKELDFEVKTTAGFTLHPNGTVYQLVADFKDRTFIVEFTKQGDYKRAVRLDRDIEPSALAVFTSGGFLVSGLSVVKRNPIEYRSFVALFDSDGRFIKNVDTGERDLNVSGTSQGVRLGRVESGESYVYILRQTANPYVLLISPSGEVLRRIALSIPEEMEVSDLRVGSGRMLVRYTSNEPDANGSRSVFYSIYDNMEGGKVLDFQQSRDIVGIFACFDWKNTFSFLGADAEGRRLMIRGTAR